MHASENVDPGAISPAARPAAAAAGAAVIRMLRAWANRDNRAMPLPTYETVPGATPSEASWHARGAAHLPGPGAPAVKASAFDAVTAALL